MYLLVKPCKFKFYLAMFLYLGAFVTTHLHAAGEAETQVDNRANFIEALKGVTTKDESHQSLNQSENKADQALKLGEDPHADNKLKPDEGAIDQHKFFDEKHAQKVAGLSSKSNESEQPREEWDNSALANLGQMFFSLLTVIVFIFVTALVFKRLGGQRILKGAAVDIKSVHPVGQKERLMIIEVYGKTMLIGVTANSINTLCQIDPEDIKANQSSMSSAQQDIPNSLGKNMMDRVQDWFVAQKDAKRHHSFANMLGDELSVNSSKRPEKEKEC